MNLEYLIQICGSSPFTADDQNATVAYTYTPELRHVAQISERACKWRRVVDSVDKQSPERVAEVVHRRVSVRVNRYITSHAHELAKRQALFMHFKEQLLVLSQRFLFGSKVGFSRILDSLSSAL